MPGLFSLFDGVNNIDDRAAQVLIAPVDDNGKVDLKKGARVLQYWPESLDDPFESGWQSKQIPGLNRPLRQWISGTDRTITFTAVFSCDQDGDVGSSDGEVEEDKHNVNINAAIAWLRSLCSNDYVDVPGSGKMAKAPPVLWLHFEGTQLGYNLGDRAPDNGAESDAGIHCVMDSCPVTYQEWFPSGRPKYVEVALSFSETIQIGGNVYAYGSSDFSKLSGKYTLTKKERGKKFGVFNR